MSISVVFVVKNAIKNGYCFIESLKSCLPFADEIVISEGYSEDDTLKYINEFIRKNQSILITLYQEKWDEKSYVGEVIAKVSANAVKKATCDWVYLLQADEILHETLANKMRQAPLSEKNSVFFYFNHFIKSWKPADHPAYDSAVRMVRRSKKPCLKGDAWSFYDVAPVYDFGSLSCHRIFHFPWVFPKSDDIKHIEHSKIYQNITSYQDLMKMACANLHKEKKPYPVDPNYNDFPQLAKRFVGALEYTLPEDYR